MANGSHFRVLVLWGPPEVSPQREVSPAGSQDTWIDSSATVTLCCSPPLSCDGKCPLRSDIPTSAKSFAALRYAAERFMNPLSSIGKATLSNALIDGIKLNVWKTKPRRRRRRRAKSWAEVDGRINVWHTQMSPRVGLSMVPMRFSKLVLPDPDLPSSMMNSPDSTVNETPRMAATPSTPTRYVLWTLLSTTQGCRFRAVSVDISVCTSGCWRVFSSHSGSLSSPPATPVLAS